MTNRFTEGRRVVDALWIRRWACELLGGSEPCDETRARVKASDPASWKAFFYLERCALPLFDLPAFHAFLPALSEPARAVLDGFRIHELKRALSVYGQLVQLSEEASRQGWRPVVLKGGVSIAEQRYLDVQDLDVLVHPGEIPSLNRYLEDAGAPEAVRRSSRPGAPPSFHGVPRRAPHALQIEVHHALKGLGGSDDLLSRAVPSPSLPGIWVLGPEDHLYHLIFHASVHHPSRAGSLRDAVLIAQTLRTSSEACVAAVRERLARLPQPDVPLRLLDFALALETGAALTDPFRATAAGNYVGFAYAEGHGGNVGIFQNLTTVLLLQGRPAYLGWVRGLLGDLPGKGVAAHLWRWMRRVSRGVKIATALPGGWMLAQRARHALRSFEIEMNGG